MSIHTLSTTSRLRGNMNIEKKETTIEITEDE